MSLTDEEVQEFKKITKKAYDIDLTDAEAHDQGGRLVTLFELLMKQVQTEKKRKKRLEKEPGGFHLEENEGPYNCRVCYHSVWGENAWWDLNGVNCLDCQRNIKEGIIPAEICRNDEIWMKDWQISNDFSLHSSTIRKLKREGVLHGRELKKEDGTVYFTVYLLAENQEFFKKYLKKPKMEVKFVNPGEPIMASKKGPIY